MVIMISWIDDNMIVGPSDMVMKLKSDLMKEFECDDCGELNEYIGNKIEHVGEDAIRFGLAGIKNKDVAQVAACTSALAKAVFAKLALHGHN